MTQPHENESAIFADAKGNPVDDADKAAIVEITTSDGNHVIMAKPRADGTIRDPFKP